jgi:clan AA aspartic protease
MATTQAAKMGAVYTTVKLTNAIDEGMVRRGVLAPRHLRQYEGQALVDTGAVMLVIPQMVADELGLQIVDQQLARFANGQEEMLGLTESIIIECEGRRTSDQALVVGDVILIGQVILEKLDLLPDCRNQQLIPNPEHPDYPVAMIY